MKEAEKSKPPSLANWLVSNLIRDGLHEEFFGDLKEVYEDRLSTDGKFYAQLMYWVDALHLLIGFTSFKLFSNQHNPTIMYKHYLNIANRNLWRNKVYSLINIGGLAVGMGACLLICQYVFFELSFDRFHDNYQNTYRIIIDKTQNDMVQAHALTTYGIGPSGKETIPEIEEYTRILTAGINVIVPNPDDNEPFTEDFIVMHFVDTTFLNVFNFPLKLGNKESVFDEKFNIVITEETAHKYFGEDNPMGKTLKLLGGGAAEEGNYTVSGVLENLPVNSHLQFQFLLPIENTLGDAVGSFTNRDAWERDSFITFITINESADLESVRKKLEQLMQLLNTSR